MCHNFKCCWLKRWVCWWISGCRVIFAHFNQACLNLGLNLFIFNSNIYCGQREQLIFWIVNWPDFNWPPECFSAKMWLRYWWDVLGSRFRPQWWQASSPNFWLLHQFQSISLCSSETNTSSCPDLGSDLGTVSVFFLCLPLTGHHMWLSQSAIFSTNDCFTFHHISHQVMVFWLKSVCELYLLNTF